MAAPDARVDAFIERSPWREAMEQLRAIVHSCPLTEEVKWGQPCYTSEGRNIVIISGFKEYCSLAFFKGALLQDARHLLVAPGENTREGRQIRFTSAKDVVRLKGVLRSYILEAIDVERSGLRAAPVPEIPMPEEFRIRMTENPILATAFHALTPGRQRLYLMHFTQPKQSKTRTARIDRCTPDILAGRGLNER